MINTKTHQKKKGKMEVGTGGAQRVGSKPHLCSHTKENKESLLRAQGLDLIKTHRIP